MTRDDRTISRMAPMACPSCGHTMDAIGTVDGSPFGAPTPGDVCGCIACGCPMVFRPDPLTGALTLRKMTRADADALTDDQKTELARVQFFARAVYQPGNN